MFNNHYYPPNHCGLLQVVKLLASSSADLNARDLNGRTPAMAAARGGFVEALMELKNGGGRPTPITQSTEHMHAHCAYANKGAWPHGCTVAQQAYTYKRMRAPHATHIRATSAHMRGTLCRIGVCPAEWMEFSKIGAELDACNEAGSTAAMWAALGGQANPSTSLARHARMLPRSLAHSLGWTLACTHTLR